MSEFSTPGSIGGSSLIFYGYKDGYEWLYNANDSYKVIIGALEINTTITQQCWCWENDQVGGPSYIFDATGPQDCSDYENQNPEWDCDFFEFVVHHDYNYKPSDGVVLQESAENLPGKIATYPMPGSNHLQMVNDWNTRIVLDEIFTGQDDIIFKIDPRH